MNTPRFARLLVIPTLLATLTLLPPARAANSILLGWNNLGMHCMDSDYSVFSILPPYNTIEAQLIVGGRLVTDGAGYTVTYQAVADPDGLVQLDRHGQGQLLHHSRSLSTAPRSPPEHGPGRLGHARPGQTPPADALRADQSAGAWRRHAGQLVPRRGHPDHPYDDAMHKNPYPLMRLVARNAAGNVLATNDDRAAGLRRDGLPRLPRLRHAGRRAARRRLGQRSAIPSATTA